MTTAAQTFGSLVNRLECAKRRADVLADLRCFFGTATAADCAWALWLLAGNRPPRIVSPNLLRAWAAGSAGIPAWLLEESYAASQDLSETFSLVAAPEGYAEPPDLATLMVEFVQALRVLPEHRQREIVERAWSRGSTADRTLYNKLISGSWRSPLKMPMLADALGEIFGVPAIVVAARLSEGNFAPTPECYRAIAAPAASDDPPAVPEPESLPAQFTIHAILVYVQAARGAGPAEYTFAVRQGEAAALVPVAKISAGVAENDRRTIERHLRLNGRQRFGPVRAVEPTLVGEIGFAEATRSPRHRAGVTLVAPRLLRLAAGVSANDADTLETVLAIASGDQS